jgi:hypothetical protein
MLVVKTLLPLTCLIALASILNFNVLTGN